MPLFLTVPSKPPSFDGAPRLVWCLMPLGLECPSLAITSKPPSFSSASCPVWCVMPGGFFFGVRCPGLVCNRLFLPCPLTWQVPVFLALLFCSPSPGYILTVPHPTRVPVTTPISLLHSEFQPLCVHSIVYLLHCFHISLQPSPGMPQCAE